MEWNFIELKGKTHNLPTTKDYIPREYVNIFKAVGSLPGEPYHIRLKQSYKPAQHHPRSVPIDKQAAYRAELDRLVKEGIIAEVHTHAQWITSITPVVKSDGHLRLCLNPKDLNKTIEWNQWYYRALDEQLPELSQYKCFTLNDANSAFLYIALELQNSLLTTFSTPWGKFKWLRLPFGSKLSWCFSRKTGQSLKTIGRCLRNCRWHPHTWQKWGGAW